MRIDKMRIKKIEINKIDSVRKKSEKITRQESRPIADKELDHEKALNKSGWEWVARNINGDADDPV